MWPIPELDTGEGKLESIFLEGLSQIMMTLGKLSADMLFFTTQELKFFIIYIRGGRIHFITFSLIP